MWYRKVRCSGSDISGVRIDPPATVNCDFAAALGDWIDGAVQLAARKAFQTPVSEIRDASSYACRRRNNAGSGKLSEHAKANALDIASFAFANRSEVTIKGQASGLLQMIGFPGGGGFLKTVRRDACKYFNTVLSPAAMHFTRTICMSI